MNNNDFKNNALAEFDEHSQDLEAGAWEENGGEFGQETPIGAAPRKRSISTGTLLIVLVIVMAAGGLWSMRSLAIALASAPKTDKGLEATIESFLESLGTNELLATDSATRPGLPDMSTEASDVLVEDRTEVQVPLEDVQKNPFILWLEPREETSEPDAPETVDNSLILRQQKIDTFENAAAKLRVVMILGGSDPMANVSGRIVHRGDKIFDDKLGVEFKVTEIGNGVVILAGEDPGLDLYYEIPLHLIQDE